MYDFPAKLPLQPAARSLFAVDPMLRERRAQPLRDQLLASPVGLGHDIDVALVLRVHPAMKVLTQQRSRLAGNRLSLCHQLSHLRFLLLTFYRSCSAASRAARRELAVLSVIVRICDL